MGHTEFLVGQSGQNFSNVREAIFKLEDLSVIFMRRWSQKEMEQAGAASAEAMKCFDYIAMELFRHRDDMKSDSTYARSIFASEMLIPTGLMVAPVLISDQMAVGDAGPGEGKLPINLAAPIGIDLVTTLNKVRHRNASIANFRIENDSRHIFVICPTKQGGGADSVVEFDVQVFCTNCRSAALQISPPTDR